MSKSAPIPVRFEKEEAEAIAKIAEESGLTNAEVIRRAVRLFFQEAQSPDALGGMLARSTPSAFKAALAAGPLERATANIKARKKK